MRISATLLHVAMLLTAGCGGATIGGTGNPGGGDGGGGGDAQPGPEGGGVDAGPDTGVVGCGGCGCGGDNTARSATPAQACEIASSNRGGIPPTLTCQTFCVGPDGGPQGNFCNIPTDYLGAYDSANADGGAADGGPNCPTWNADVVIQCEFACLGRRTAGVDEPCRDDGSLGDVFAGRAYLEEVSVHAFARLERELAAHGAPAQLRREARRARRDEIRHTAMTARLARRYGGEARRAAPPPETPARSLFEIALENAVEGCVRESYGAVVGLVEARRSSDPQVRRAMESIAADECRHAELAWAVWAWAMPRLTEAERARVRAAVRETVEALSRDGDGAIVALLDAQVWRAAA